MADSGIDAVAHLVRRATFGMSPDLATELETTSAVQWLDDQLNPERVADPVCDEVVARYPSLDASITTVHEWATSGRTGFWDVMFDLGTVAVARAMFSRRQLLEVMVDVWSNLLAVTCPSSEVWDCRHRYDADVIRRHALGRYDDLLVAAVTHPAMLNYLTNAQSTKSDPNENLGREVLELHTVGVDAGYTERDVRNSALILTGLSVDHPAREFRYRRDHHYVGPVRVLGFSHANASSDGRPVVEAYLRHLAALPATARRVCHRLAVRFVADDPPADLVERLAGVYLAGGTAIRPVLQALFGSQEFAASVGAKTRTPLESLLASARALGLRPPATGTAELRHMYWMTDAIGQPPYAWPQPDGYPDVAESWQSAAVSLGRWNLNSALVGGWWPKNFPRPALTSYLPNPLPATHGELVEVLSRRLRRFGASPAERAAVCAFLGVSETTPVRTDSPAVRWRLEHVLDLLLDSPAQVAR